MYTHLRSKTCFLTVFCCCDVIIIDDTETRLLAQHMGKKFNIHVEHYALQTRLLERGKVARVLCTIKNRNMTPGEEKRELSVDATQVFSDEEK